MCIKTVLSNVVFQNVHLEMTFIKEKSVIFRAVGRMVHLAGVHLCGYYCTKCTDDCFNVVIDVGEIAKYCYNCKSAEIDLDECANGVDDFFSAMIDVDENPKGMDDCFTTLTDLDGYVMV